MNKKKGILVVFSGFAGSGKGTIMKELIARYPDEYALSVSATTRKPRPQEEEGREYFFKTKVNTDKQREDHTICFYRTDQESDGSHYKEIYNHTSLSAEELYHLEYKFYSDGFGKSEMQYGGHSYIVFCYDKVPDIFVYRIQDMNSVLGRIRQLGIYIAAITALVITFAILILYFLLIALLFLKEYLTQV